MKIWFVKSLKLLINCQIKSIDIDKTSSSDKFEKINDGKMRQESKQLIKPLMLAVSNFNSLENEASNTSGRPT